MAQMDTGMRRDAALHNDSEAGRVAIVAVLINAFSPKSTAPSRSRTFCGLAALRVHAMLLGPESGMREYARATLFGTFGVPLRVYPGLKINFISPPSSAPCTPSPRTLSTSSTPSLRRAICRAVFSDVSRGIPSELPAIDCGE
ncbi:hypothetical protein B0H13DRAFT_2343178 [Mycena leptocephala]|nr:hypothetical protein B0H13DRAFT_2343178 [Mycena leptocephala]